MADNGRPDADVWITEHHWCHRQHRLRRCGYYVCLGVKRCGLWRCSETYEDSNEENGKFVDFNDHAPV